MKNNLLSIVDGKFWHFILVGIVNTIVGTSIMFGLYNVAGVSYWGASAANYTLTSMLSYILNKYFTFQHKKNTFVSAIRFTLTIAICYLLAYGIAKPLTYSFLSSTSVTIQENVAMFVGMVFFTLINYFGQRYFAFK